MTPTIKKSPTPAPPIFVTWLCSPLTGRAQQPASVIFATGRRSNDVVRVYERAREEQLGSLFIVRESSARPPKLAGAVAARNCSAVGRGSLPPPSSSAAAGLHALRSDHPSARSTRNTRGTLDKLALLEHLPRDVESVTLVDADTHCVGDCTAKMRRQLLAMASAGTFVGIGISGERSRAVGRRHRCPANHVTTNRRAVLRPERQLCRRTDAESYNGGVVLLHLVRFRAWASSFCAEAWWTCVVAARPANASWATADQSIWGLLLTKLQPQIAHIFPCGLHAETAVLRGLGLRLGLLRHVGEARHHASNAIASSGQRTTSPRATLPADTRTSHAAPADGAAGGDEAMACDPLAQLSGRLGEWAGNKPWWAAKVVRRTLT